MTLRVSHALGEILKNNVWADARHEAECYSGECKDFEVLVNLETGLVRVKHGPNPEAVLFLPQEEWQDMQASQYIWRVANWIRMVHALDWFYADGFADFARTAFRVDLDAAEGRR